MEQRDRGFRAAVASVETIADELQATLGDQLAALAEQQRALAATVAEQGELLSRLEQQLAALERRDDPAH
jgi:septal ring factor EnvC (AmiA/AmiB activator)